MGIERFFDSNVSVDKRIDALLEALTAEEKCSLIASHMPDIDRLGLKGVDLGGEAAHGVQQRNDEGPHATKEPVKTTSFPQPVGMCASWDREALYAAGEVTGVEARLIASENGNQGLSRWAPTVDLLRDPRWGRNEEGYSEDPLLTGELAGSYVRGMQGEDPKHHLRIASTLKHFYANNTEDGRAHKDSAFDERNKKELYLEVFRRVILKGQAEGVMTAYNKINGVPGMLNDEVKTVLKEKYGIVHAVSDGHALTLLRIEHHYSDDDSVNVADSLKAGVDSMPDDPAMVKEAVKGALEKGLITEEDLDCAIRNTMRTRLKLGVYDKQTDNPYADVKGETIGSAKAKKACLDLTRESMVLLENDGTLPLSPETDPKDILLAGPMGDRWDQDWYCGEPMYRTTIRDGLKKLLKGEIEFEEGLDRIRLFKADEDNTLIGEFFVEDWGEGCLCLRDAETGKYLSSPINAGEVKADHDSSFEWFPTTVFAVDDIGNDAVSLRDWKKRRLVFDKEDGLKSLASEETGEKTNAAEGELERAKNQKIDLEIPEDARFRIETVISGSEAVSKAAAGKKAIFISLGNQPLVKAREGTDRTRLSLPEKQSELIEKISVIPDVKDGRCKVVLLLTANYPYALGPVLDKVNAVLCFASGSQDLGTAVAETLFGKNAPAGRLTQTWPESEKDLPSIDDYDIIGGGRTYRYSEKKPLYPFGYGLTYTEFEYDTPKVSYTEGEGILLEMSIRNTGECAGDEVVQIYGIAPRGGIKKPLSQLIAFERVKDVKPKESRELTFRIDPRELSFYDTEKKRFALSAGEYRICAGRSSEDRTESATITLPELYFE
ncbi:MAG: glycoside hydrolase family 3 C-terminal domain-containing protein [Lachnospiraceae bacterium]|nr:glycoside hydrolase family 3 C-terminal domain-containing protein [Lachnospiraceae bacterium]